MTDMPSTVSTKGWPKSGDERAAGGESQARFTVQFSMRVVSLTIPLRPVLVDGASRRCSWTGPPSTNRRRYRYARLRLMAVGEDFHRFLKKISFCANDFSAWMPISKVEGLTSKIGGTESPDASLPPAATHAGT